MQLWDYHTHNVLCNHAVGSIEDYVRTAIQQNLCEIGISDHFPMFLLPEPLSFYAMSLGEFPHYISEIKNLQQEYPQIKIRVASEVDFHPIFFSNYKETIKPFIDEFDYMIGSVHAIDFKSEGLIVIDETQPIRDIQKIGIDRVYLKYYDLVLKMVKTGFYHILGHFDVLNKFGLEPTDSEMINEKICDILDSIERADMVIEINTSGFRKQIREQYPNDFLLRKIIERELPLTLGSDAHHPNQVGNYFNEVIQKVKFMGLRKLFRFSKKEKIPVIIN